MIEVTYAPTTAPVESAVVRCTQEPYEDYLEVRPDYSTRTVAIQPTSQSVLRNTVFVHPHDIEKFVDVLRAVKDQVS